VTTIERWYYAHKKAGLEGLRPRRRCDRGRCRKLSDEQRTLLVDIRGEFPSATVPLILRTLISDGRLDEKAISASAVQRLYRQHGLDRIPLRDGASPKTRLRWEAERPGALWHGDVCHASPIIVDGLPRPVRIHGMLDDASRYIVAIEARYQEREEDMLELLVGAIRRHGPPDGLYLDNGSTYSGETLRLFCARLNMSLQHARPYDPEARGKMERFWRTLREGCLDFLGSVSSLHDVNVRMLAFLDTHYHTKPHASLMGLSPETAFRSFDNAPDAVDERSLREALTERVQRRVRRDSTVSINGTNWELDQGYLAGQTVTAARCWLNPKEAPWIEHDDRVFELHPVDVKKNGRSGRPARRVSKPSSSSSKAPPEFDPNRVAMNKLFGKKPAAKKPGDT
jgi:putative transposase